MRRPEALKLRPENLSADIIEIMPLFPNTSLYFRCSSNKFEGFIFIYVNVHESMRFSMKALPLCS